jgi:hypothetical protein
MAPNQFKKKIIYMAKFIKKPLEIEAITFEEFVEFGRQNGGNIVDGMPWSFNYKGHSVTHENDECYLVPTHQGIVQFTPDDMLITQIDGEIYPCKKELFILTYDRAEQNEIEFNKTFLEKRGFVLVNQDNVIINYIKKINEYNDLVVAVSPLPEFFIWVKDEDFEDPDMEGVKVHLDTDDFDFAENMAHAIAGVEYL